MRLRSTLKLPKEHGAWAMLYVPLVMGVLVAGEFKLQLVLLALSATFFFIARESVLAWWRLVRRKSERDQPRRMMIIYLGLASALAAPLLAVYRLYWLVAVGAVAAALVAVNAEQSVRRKDRTIAGELLAIIGLTMSSLASHYVARDRLEPTAFWVWGLNILYFASSVFYVRMRVQTAHANEEKTRTQIRWQCGAYHSFMLAVLLGFASRGSLSPLVLLAFVPVLARAGWHLALPASKLNLKRIGILEIVYSLVFMAVVTLTFGRN